MYQGCPAGNGFDHRDTVFIGKSGQLFGRQGVVHTTTCDQQGFLCALQQFGSGFECLQVRPWPWYTMHYRLEENRRIIERLGLGILRQGDKCRSAVSGVEHCCNRLR